MKKLRIDIQSLLHNAVYLTAIQKILSAVNCLNKMNHSAEFFSDGITNISCTTINKNKTPSFQLPK